MGFRVFDLFFPAAELPLPPGSDDLEPRRQRLKSQLKTDLVVPFAGRAVGDRVGLLFFGYLNLLFGDQRPGNGGSQQILVFIDRSRLEHRENKIAGEFVLQIFDIDLSRPRSSVL